MHTILVLTDFSDTAFHAAEYASFLAKYYKTQQLLLLNSFFLNPTALANEPVIAMGIPDLEKESNQLLSDWKQKLSIITGEGTTINTLTSNLPLDEVVEQAGKEEDVQMAVMGMKGKSNLEKVLIGSTAIRTINSINYPLLLIPSEAPITIPQTVVIGIDLPIFRQMDKTALLNILDLLQARVLLINIAKNDRYAMELKEEIVALHDIFDKYNAEFHYVTDSDIPGTINKFAQEEKADMIITIHRKNNSIIPLFQKSTTKRLAWNTKVPLLVLPL
ncbi:universal stress protein [Chitinophaga sp. Cy-1792]|uniref:universal stress protein n=1 Tax=Chitinophaga sp. Cy-1792 TaxID=2608339 RepID=UPI001423115F|nr:universal stress protein [Chitinophaga sp. Cy-1792]NIG57466.1 universal stress protein [Chitinophaga sp. Cy-1792]